MARKVKVYPRTLVHPAMTILSKVYPGAPLEIPKGEIDNVLSVLTHIIEGANRSPEENWGEIWSELEHTWVVNFISHCRMIQEPPLQEAFAMAFLHEALNRGRLGHRDMDTLAKLTVQDWGAFTWICSFSSFINGRITPLIFNFGDDIYRDSRLGSPDLDSLIATGLITKEGTGDVYTLGITDEGLSIKYFDEEEFTVKRLPAPIARSYLGRTMTKPHPLDDHLNVGVVDFTQVGRTLGFLTPCSKVNGFVDYLENQWEEYFREGNGTEGEDD